MKKKISKEKFLESFNYLEAINSSRLKDLDLSELFEDSPEMEKAVRDFFFVGLTNVDFITSDYPFKYKIKRKFKLFRKQKL